MSKDGKEQARTWETAGKRAPRAKRAPGSGKRLLRKLLLFVGLPVVLITLVLLAAAPTIASSMAPGMIERAAEERLSGELRVERASVSWFGGASASVELMDPGGRRIGQVEVGAGVSMWRALTQRWWSRNEFDLGTLTLAGSIDVVRDADGTTNVADALAPPTAPSSSRGGSLLDLRFDLELDDLDVSVTQKRDGAPPTTLEIAELAGGGGIELGLGVATTFDVALELDGAVRADDADAQVFTLELDADGRLSSRAEPDLNDASLTLAGLPIASVDRLLAMDGALVDAFDESGKLTLSASGSLDRGAVEVAYSSARGTVDGAFSLRGARVSPARAFVADVPTLGFLAGVPQLAPALARASSSMTLDDAPSFRIEVRDFGVTLPRPDREGGAAARGVSFAGAPLDATIELGALVGEVSLPIEVGADIPEGADPPPQRVSVPASVFTLRSDDLTSRITLAGEMSPTLDGEPAGTVRVDLAAPSPLGGGRVDPLMLRGSATVERFTTALLQPLADSFGLALDLSSDVGPTLDVVVRVIEEESSVSEVALDASVRAAHVRIDAPLRLTEEFVAHRTGSVEVNLERPAPALRRLLGEHARIDGAGPIALSIDDFRIPLDAERLRTDATGSLGVTLAGIIAAPMGGDGELSPVVAERVVFNARRDEGGEVARLTLDARLAYEGRAFSVTGDVRGDPSRVPSGGVPADVLRSGPRGEVRVDDVPRELLALVPGLGELLEGSVSDAGEVEARVVEGVRATIGERASVLIELTEPERALADATGVRVSGESGDVRASVRGVVTPESLELTTLRTTAMLTQGRVDPVLQAAFGETARLGGATSLVVALPEPWSVGLDESLAPVLDDPEQTALGVVVTTEPGVAVLGVPVGDGESGRVADVGTRNLALRVEMAPGSGGLGAVLTGALISATPGQERAVRYARVRGEGSLSDGAIDASLALLDANATALGDFVERPTLLADVLGRTANVTFGVARAAPDAEMVLTASVESAFVEAPAARLSITDEAFGIEAPVRVTWSPTPGAATRLLFPQEERRASFESIEPVTLDVKRLSIARSRGDRGPLDPDRFRLNVDIAMDSAVLRSGGGGGPVRLERIEAHAEHGGLPGEVLANLTIDSVISETGATRSPSGVSARFTRLADSRGNLTPDQARVDAESSLSSIPTPLIGAFTPRSGVLVDLLGPTATVQATADGLSRTEGTIELRVDAPRATAFLDAEISDGQLRTRAPVRLSLMEINRRLLRDLSGVLPMIASIEKSKDQGASVIEADGLTFPLGIESREDWRELNGDISIDLGVATYTLERGLVRFLSEAVGAEEQGGVVGQRIKPFMARAREGRITFDRYEVPLGEFTIGVRARENEGVDLPTGTIDLVIDVPVPALTDEALGLFNTGIGGVLAGTPLVDRLTTVPFRVRGDMASPSFEPDIELLLEERANDLINLPGNIFEGLPGLILDDVLNPGG